jgi:hypothetical protein
MLGRAIPEEVLSRALYATQFTRQIDKHGYVRFKMVALAEQLTLPEFGATG